MKNGEDMLQIACVRWFRVQFPNIIIHHSPNGGKRNLMTAIKFKAMGTLAGFPDLFIAYPAKGYNGLFIEMKDGKKGVVSQAQKDVIANLKSYGYKAEVVRTFQDFVNIVSDYIMIK